MEDHRRVPAWVGRTWNWISNALNFQQLLALIGTWKFILGVGGAVVGLVLAGTGGFPVWGWALAASVGAAIALFISNEITSRRLHRRHSELTRSNDESQSASLDDLPPPERAALFELAAEEARKEIAVAPSPSDLGEEVTVLRKELTKAEAERDERDAENRRLQRQIVENAAKHEEYVTSVRKVIDRLETKAEWADSLIERERPRPLLNMPMAQCYIGSGGHLGDAEPYFDIVIVVVYRGVLRFTIEPCSGKFQWNGLAFADPPQVVHGGMPEGPLPFSQVGPTEVHLRFRQYVHGRADEIKAYLASNVEMDLWTGAMSCEYRFETFDGEVLHRRNLFGSDLTARKPQ